MITSVLDEKEATKISLEMAEKGDLVVLQVDDVNQVIKDVLDYKKKIKKHKNNIHLKK